MIYLVGHLGEIRVEILCETILKLLPVVFLTVEHLFLTGSKEKI